MINSTFYTCHQIHFTGENASFCDICLSVCHIPHIPFIYSVLERCTKLSMGILLLTLVNGEVNFKMKRQRSLRMKMQTKRFLHISSYTKPTAKWSSVHSTHIDKYISQAKMHNFFNICVFWKSYFVIARNVITLVHLAWHTNSTAGTGILLQIISK